MGNINIKLPDDLHQQLKFETYREGVLIKNKVVELIKKYVEEKEYETKE